MRSSRSSIRRSKLGRVITAPFRMITNAGNFYVRSMEGLAGRVGSVGGGGGMGGPAMLVPPTLPKSLSVSSLSREIDQEGEEFRELVRAVSRRRSGGGRGGVGVGMGMRSYSVGVGKIGKIDEDEPCEFEEDTLSSGGVNKKKKGGVDLGLYFLRSKSHAIGVNVNHNHTNNTNVGFVY